jgi:hypothetical protein
MGAAMNDRDIYQTLSMVADELMKLSESAETVVGQTALLTAASTIAGTAKAVYDHVVGGEDPH